MNVENVRKLRDLLREVAEKNPKRFNMTTWFSKKDSYIYSVRDVSTRYCKSNPADCGTCACMAGWCQMAFAETDEDRVPSAYSFARDFCGIDDCGAMHWFCGHWAGTSPRKITATDAADFLTEQLRAAGAEP